MDLQIENVKKYLVEKEERENLLRQKERERIISGLKALGSVWDKHRVRRVYLYGSFTDMTFHKYSDIDIAIEPDIPFDELLSLFSEVNKYIGREVDVRLLSELPFSETVRRSGFIVYERKNSHTEE